MGNLKSCLTGEEFEAIVCEQVAAERVTPTAPVSAREELGKERTACEAREEARQLLGTIIQAVTVTPRGDAWAIEVTLKNAKAARLGGPATATGCGGPQGYELDLGEIELPAGSAARRDDLSTMHPGNSMLPPR